MRLLFVDDEPSIRATMPAILRKEGFEVAVAATVPEGLDLIQREKFDILLTDLNVGNPGDGFVLVSAMRRTQPESKTFILTGYPDFETALQAIRQQVDDYFLKPADIPELVRKLKERLVTPRHLRNEATKRAPQILREQSQRIVDLWLAQVLANDRLSNLPLDVAERTRHIPLVIELLARTIEAGEYALPDDAHNSAAEYGEARAHAGYNLSLLLKESNILATVISQVLQENLLVADLSTIIPDVLTIGVCLNALLEDALASFLRVRSSAVA